MPKQKFTTTIDSDLLEKIKIQAICFFLVGNYDKRLSRPFVFQCKLIVGLCFIHKYRRLLARCLKGLSFQPLQHLHLLQLHKAAPKSPALFPTVMAKQRLLPDSLPDFCCRDVVL